MKKKIVITIPAFNEEESIGAVINDITAVMKERSYTYIIQVVDDGSTDATVAIARKQGARVISNGRNLGLAETFRREISEALKLNPDIIIHTDADGQYPAKYIPQLIQKIEEGNHLVLGSRFYDGGKHSSYIKQLGNIAFAIVFSRLCKQKITDTTTGFRAFTQEVAREITFTSAFTYTQEQIIRARKLKFRIAEVPIHARATRESRLFNNVFEYAIKAWINILRVYRDYEPLKFFGGIGFILICIGAGIGLWIISLVLTTGRVGHIPATILSGVLVLLGIQVVLFGFLADMNKK